MPLLIPEMFSGFVIQGGRPLDLRRLDDQCSDLMTVVALHQGQSEFNIVSTATFAYNSERLTNGRSLSKSQDCSYDSILLTGKSADRCTQTLSDVDSSDDLVGMH